MFHVRGHQLSYSQSEQDERYRGEEEFKNFLSIFQRFVRGGEGEQGRRGYFSDPLHVHVSKKQIFLFLIEKIF